ncbi:MAG: carboxypeptidase-like regulatory domain-containing protein, partial [Promethearchaeota archaeon]
QIQNRSLALSTSLGGTFLLSQDQPLITSLAILPDPNTIKVNQPITIKVEAFDLDGIAEVWGVINASYSPSIFSGEAHRPILDLPEIKFDYLQDEGVYNAIYSSLNYPGIYNLLVFAKDKKGNTSLPFTYSLNVSPKAEPETRAALLISGWGKDALNFSNLLSHAERVILEKGFDLIEVLSQPSSQDVEDTLDAFNQSHPEQLFVYLIGLTERDTNQQLQFLLNPNNETLDPNTLDIWLDNVSCPSQIVLIDTNSAQDFIRPAANRIYLCSTSSNEKAYLEQENYLAFSHFFFTCIYWGANLYQAWLYSWGAIQYYSNQTPQLEDAHSVIKAEEIYLGTPFEIETAGPRIIGPPDQIVWGETPLWAKVESDNPITRVWAFIRMPSGDLDEEEFSWSSSNEQYEVSYSFEKNGLYEVTTYAEDQDGLVDYDCTRYLRIGKDAYESDDSPDQASPMLINVMSQIHNFHISNDQDWVVFHAYEERPYEISIMRYEEFWADPNCSLMASIHYLDGNIVKSDPNVPMIIEYDKDVLFDYPHFFVFDPPETEFYLIRFTYGCEDLGPDTPTYYELTEITDGLSGKTGIISGHVRHDEYHFGIEGVTIKAKIKTDQGNLLQKGKTESGEKGLFYLFDLMPGDYEIHTEAQGYRDSVTTSIPVAENSSTSFTIYLSQKDPNIPRRGRHGDYQDKYHAVVENSYQDWEKEHLVLLYPGINLFSCPCQPLAYDSECLIQDIHDLVKEHYSGEDLPSEYFTAIRRYDSHNKQWHVSFIDVNQSIQGDCFDLDPRAAYLVYIQIPGASKQIKSFSLPISCALSETNDMGYDLRPVMNLTGFLQSPVELNSDDLIMHPDIKDFVTNISHFLPQNGKFHSYYRFFGKPCDQPHYFTEDKGYIFFIKEEILDWQP